MRLEALVRYLDEYLGTPTAQDYSDNGLQVEGSGEVHRLAFAVDTSLEGIDEAIAQGADLLIVHHGLFWGKPLRIIGPHRRRVAALLAGGCSLYAVHLPLDRHPEVGNNVQLARVLGLTVTGDLGEAFGMPIGVTASAPPGTTVTLIREIITERLGAVPLLLPGGQEAVRRVGIISGGAAKEIATAVAAGCDTYITGEASHSIYHDATEYGINVFFAGHYATETLGLKALAAHLASRFSLDWQFIDLPTGL